MGSLKKISKNAEALGKQESEKTKTNCDPIILAALFHYKFIRIHPFDDGNGRTVRILMNFILMQFGYPPVIIKTEYKSQYYSALQQADGDNFDPFFDLIAMNLVRSLELMIRAAKGQSIEEPDDLDKEIGLLDLKLRSVSKRVEKIKSEDTLKEFSRDVLPVVLTSFFEAGNSFMNYFIKQNTKLTIDKNHWPDLNDEKVKNIIEANLKSLPDMITVEFLLTEMRYIGFEPYGINFRIEILLNRNNLEITASNWSYRMLYDEEFSEKETAQLKRSLKENGKLIIENFIQQVKNSQNENLSTIP